jgi:prepilin-type N-terminal cleavage/methylation domain-containing protein
MEPVEQGTLPLRPSGKAFNPALSPMSSPLTHGGRDAYKAFTLIELLTVIAIIGILAGITFGVIGIVQERANQSQARTEVATLAQALESYKRQYGDYPQLGASTHTASPTTAVAANSVERNLFNALMGKMGPTKAPMQGKQFVEASKLNLQNTSLPTAGNTTPVDNAFVDPWGRLYLYYYRETGANFGNWKQPSYILVSPGIDGVMGITVDAAGLITETDAARAADNIYANR